MSFATTGASLVNTTVATLYRVRRSTAGATSSSATTVLLPLEATLVASTVLSKFLICPAHVLPTIIALRFGGAAITG